MQQTLASIGNEERPRDNAKERDMENIERRMEEESEESGRIDDMELVDQRMYQ